MTDKNENTVEKQLANIMADKMKKVYPDGSYFTREGDTVTHHMFIDFDKDKSPTPKRKAKIWKILIY